MQVILSILGDGGWIEFGRFWDMSACDFVLGLLADVGGVVGVCAAGVAV